MDEIQPIKNEYELVFQIPFLKPQTEIDMDPNIKDFNI
mgnify:CR=1 FL=1